MTQPLINSHFLNGLNEIIRDRGANCEDFARKAGLDPSVLGDRESLIPYDKHNQLLELAASELDFPNLGLELARQQTVSVFGPLFPMMTNQPTIKASLEIFARHLQIRVQNLNLSIEVSEEIGSIAPQAEMEYINNSRTFEDHALGLAWQLIQLLHNGPCKARAVYFKHSAPEDVTPYTRYFKCPVAFDHHRCELVIDPAVLNAPVCDDVRQLPQLLRQHMELKHHDQLINQVREVIAGLLVTGHCTINEVAPAMGYSTRTLQRHLKSQDATFQALVDSVRHQQAQIYLANANYRLTDIAALLGYSELSAFTRSFKRWFGESPQKWRKNLPLTPA